MIALLICVISMQVTVVVLLSDSMNGMPIEHAIRSIILQMILTSVVLLAEAIVYRILQYRLYRIRWVWVHVSSLYFLVLILPILFVFLNFFIRRRVEAFESFEWIRKLNLLRNILFWSVLLIGHLFFVLTIVRAFSKKSEPEEQNNESSDFLDEFPS